MARMKIEVQAARVAKHGLSLRDRLVGYLPRYAPYRGALARPRQPARRQAQAASNGRRHMPGLSTRRSLPRWRSDAWREPSRMPGADNARAVVFFADTFNRYFEPENIEAALGVLTAAGYGVHLPKPADGSSRPLCCGRTFLSVGLVEEARARGAALRRGTRAATSRAACRSSGSSRAASSASATSFRRWSRATTRARSPSNALLFEEFLAREAAAGTLDLPLKPVAKRALLHGHCHQKSFGAMGAVEAVLRLVPELAVETVESSCCGMAGAFGYGADTIDVSLKMAELSLLPAVRKAEPDTLVVADGTSCRHQIKDGSRARRAPRRARAGDEPQSVRRRRGHLARLKHDPEKCAAVFGKDHAQTRS